LANSSSARKRARQNIKRRRHNMALRSKYRTYVKSVLASIAEGNQAKAQERFRAAVPVLDAMVNKGIIHKNKAARHKSRLNSKIRSLQA